MMINKLKTIVLVVIFGLTKQLYSQSIIEITLEEAISLAKEGNKELSIQKQEIEIAKREYQKTNAIFFPKITLSEVGVQTDDPLNAFGFLLQQRNVQTTDFNPEKLNDPGNSVNWNTNISVEQPLINIDGFYGRKAADYQIESIKQNTKRKYQHLEFHIKEAYFSIQLALEQKKVIKKSVDAINESFRVLQNNFEQGYIQEADLLKVKVRKLELENQLAEADNNIINASNQLSYLIYGEIGKSFILTDTLRISEGSELLEVNNISPDRSDFLSLEYAKKAYSMQLKMNRTKFIPSLNAFGEYNLYDTQIFGSQSNSYLVGVALKWNIFNGGHNIASTKKSSALLIKSELEIERAKNHASLSLDKATRTAKTLKLKLETLKLAINQSEKAYSMTYNSFLAGQENIDKVLLYEAMVSRKKLEYQVALYQYYIALSNIQLQSK